LPVGCALAAVVLLLFNSVLGFSASDELADPVPIQRVLITAAHLLERGLADPVDLRIAVSLVTRAGAPRGV